MTTHQASSVTLKKSSDFILLLFFLFGKYDSIYLGTNKLKVLEMLRGHSI